MALLKAADLDAANLSRDIARLLALELFREEKVSLRRAAELCHTPLAVFRDFAAAHEVSPVRDGNTSHEDERQALTPEEWVREFKAWTRSHSHDDLPVLSDEAMSREFIYRERGLYWPSSSIPSLARVIVSRSRSLLRRRKSAHRSPRSRRGPVHCTPKHD